MVSSVDLAENGISDILGQYLLGNKLVITLFLMRLCFECRFSDSLSHTTE